MDEYVAGFFDGEGSFIASVRDRGNRFEFNLQLSMVQNNKEVLEEIAKYYSFPKNKVGCFNHSGSKRWRLTLSKKEDIEKLLHKIEPFIRVKKEQLKLFKEILDKRVGSGAYSERWINGKYQGYSKEEQLDLLRLIKKIQILNRGKARPSALKAEEKLKKDIGFMP